METQKDIFAFQTFEKRYKHCILILLMFGRHEIKQLEMISFLNAIF